MITCLLFAASRAENERIRQLMGRLAARNTDEKWEFRMFDRMEAAEACLSSEPVIDLLSWDVTVPGALQKLAGIRKQYREALLVIVADMGISPTGYLKPSIAPDALLMKPLQPELSESMLTELFERFQREDRAAEENAFTVETREETRRIPLSQIDCFEARTKKLYIRTRTEEYGFYGTLEEVEKTLSEDSGFLRCHRGFLVNMNRCSSVLMAEGLIRMQDGCLIPFSRSCRKAVKEYMKCQ